jgi:hypothetical protein
MEQNNIPTRKNGGLIGAYKFAAKHGVTPMAVYRKINNGEITTVPDGKQQLIDWRAHDHITFDFADKWHAGRERKTQEA